MLRPHTARMYIWRRDNCVSDGILTNKKRSMICMRTGGASGGHERWESMNIG